MQNESDYALKWPIHTLNNQIKKGTMQNAEVGISMVFRIEASLGP